ncbi:MAG: PilZ domain-containing protein [Acidobacteriota bacterium]
MEKRSVSRTAYILIGVANVETNDERGYRMIDVRARDVSADGAYLYAETKNPPEAGQKVRVLLHSAPELKNSSMKFQANGVVVRLEDDQVEREPGFAVKFENAPDISEM